MAHYGLSYSLNSQMGQDIKVLNHLIFCLPEEITHDKSIVANRCTVSSMRITCKSSEYSTEM